MALVRYRHPTVRPEPVEGLAYAKGLRQAQPERWFIVTPDNVTREMLKLADVKPGDFVIDLGSGDVRIVIVGREKTSKLHLWVVK